jgi:hypothetical protein
MWIAEVHVRARSGSTFQVMKATGFYPCPAVDTAGSRVVSQAGGVLLTETVRAVGLDRALSAELARWRHPNAVHDLAKIVLDLAVAHRSPPVTIIAAQPTKDPS